MRFLFRKFELGLFSDPTETLLESHETLLPKEEQELESTGKAKKPEFLQGRVKFKDEYRIEEICDEKWYAFSLHIETLESY